MELKILIVLLDHFIPSWIFIIFYFIVEYIIVCIEEN